MGLPGKKVPAGAGGIRWWLSTVVVSAVALVLILVVISLSVGSSMPGASLPEYLIVTTNDTGKLSSVRADRNENDTAVDVPSPGEELQGVQEPFADHTAQSGSVNSSEASLGTRQVDDKEPDPVATGDTAQKPDEGTIPDSTDSSSDHQRGDQDKEPDPVATDDTTQKPDSADSSSDLQRAAQDKEPDPVATNGTTLKPDESTIPDSADTSSNLQRADQGTCDLYRGQWVFDSAGPLYTNNSCPLLTQMQNCQGNGRPDKGYESWRWKPEQCILPRFDARKFLGLMRGKTLAFVGDSVSRNQMESLLCILWQVETPVNRGNRKMNRWIFRSTRTTIIRIWSSWLVHRSIEAVGFAPKGLDKVFLDVPDETFMEILPTFNVVVLSSGHWFAKRSAYILNGNVVGGQLWWPRHAGKMQVNNVDAFGLSVETYLTAVATNPNFRGIVVLRSYSPDHYEGGAWNTGGSCTGKVKPLDEVVRNGFTDIMYGRQVAGFRKAVQNSGEHSSKLKLMDITEPFSLRADGHPGPYRTPDPNKKTQRGPDGKPPPQDCLHWCMPGPVDTWNEMLYETVRREFGGDTS